MPTLHPLNIIYIVGLLSDYRKKNMGGMFMFFGGMHVHCHVDMNMVLLCVTIPFRT